MVNNSQVFRDVINKIEEFKLEMDKVKAFTPEERLAILKSFSDSIFRQSINEQHHSTQAPLSIQKVDKSKTGAKEGNGYQTFAELVRLTKLRQHPDLILLSTYYLIVLKKSESVTTTDIEQQYSAAMLKVSTNTNANINVNRKKGYMMEGDKKEGKMSFRITMSGTDYIESILESIG